MTTKTTKGATQKVKLKTRLITSPKAMDLHKACRLILTDARLEPLKEFLMRVNIEKVDPAKPGADRLIWHCEGRKHLAAQIFSHATNEPPQEKPQ